MDSQKDDPDWESENEISISEGEDNVVFCEKNLFATGNLLLRFAILYAGVSVSKTLLVLSYLRLCIRPGHSLMMDDLTQWAIRFSKIWCKYYDECITWKNSALWIVTGDYHCQMYGSRNIFRITPLSWIVVKCVILYSLLCLMPANIILMRVCNVMG